MCQLLLQKCEQCRRSFGYAFCCLSPHRAAVIKGKVEDEYHDVKIDEVESDDDIAATDKYEAGVSTPRLWWFEQKNTPVDDFTENIVEEEGTDKFESSAKTEIAVGLSRATAFKPVDWTKCLKCLKSRLKVKRFKRISIKILKLGL